MSELLWKYMEERLQQKGYLPVNLRHGPVITLSREAGCAANPIARALLRLIQQERPAKEKQWKIVNKEIVHEAARELEISPDKISYVFKAEERKLLDEMLAALTSRYYKSDQRIRKTITGVIRRIIDDGYVIMVGRGGVAFTRGKTNTLNVFLQAPLEWRIRNVSEKYRIPYDKAAVMVAATDKERKLLTEHFQGKKVDPAIYDVIINVSSFSIEQTAELLYQMAKDKSLI